MRVLVTGTAGFIGFHVAKMLTEAGHDVVGIDGMTAYYDVALKQRRHAMLLQSPNFTAHELMLEDEDKLAAAYSAARPEVVIHLAAQAGVRYSLENPRAYVDTNLVGSFNLMECVRRAPPRHFLLASTSSVYGGNTKMPFVESDPTDHPLTLYAASKKATEVMTHSYAHLWGIPTTVFRFFTVYGPWGRPDMALFKFTKGIIEGTPIDIYNNGDMARDFTYIDDLAHAIVLLAHTIPPDPQTLEDEAAGHLGLSPVAPYRVVNIGNGEPVRLTAFIEAIEQAIGRPAIRNYMPMQPGDVPATFADASLLERLTGFRPATPVALGVKRFVAWYRDYFNQ
ncbi:MULTISPECIES: NAD-dependent epimerase [unclassified Chelatococcus]|uniref:NAD-dependent epimerase n=1 Tax=unclassified Chelatococcus TaxID=2638111 RepID=UPI001BCF2138|nr:MULTISPECIES: NAD-dependent epimerase [unclassified Chelatococcus]MBS7697983.1 NAD-dependent epimerase [Chelatococcus sp. YT9]MBX3556699.1 NAD-dependent epimerase [Chelatococcus sp.]